LLVYNPPALQATTSIITIEVVTLTGDRTLSSDSATIQDLTNPIATTQDIFLPLTPRVGRNFLLINEPTSLGNLSCNGTEILPGEQYEVLWNGTRWIEL
jgi:hypothetical protein